jgi:hypothetical protein
MELLRSQALRWATAIALLGLAATAVVGWAGGADPFDGVRAALFGALMLAWLIPDLQAEPGAWTRRLLWCGVICSAVLLVASTVELVA